MDDDTGLPAELQELFDTLDELESIFEEQELPVLAILSDSEGILDVEFQPDIPLSYAQLPTFGQWLIAQLESQGAARQYDTVSINFATQANRAVIAGVHLS